jgi:hypothetical protein
MLTDAELVTLGQSGDKAALTSAASADPLGGDRTSGRVAIRIRL